MCEFVCGMMSVCMWHIPQLQYIKKKQLKKNIFI